MVAPVPIVPLVPEITFIWEGKLVETSKYVYFGIFNIAISEKLLKPFHFLNFKLNTY